MGCVLDMFEPVVLADMPVQANRYAKAVFGLVPTMDTHIRKQFQRFGKVVILGHAGACAMFLPFVLPKTLVRPT